MMIFDGLLQHYNHINLLVFWHPLVNHPAKWAMAAIAQSLLQDEEPRDFEVPSAGMSQQCRWMNRKVSEQSDGKTIGIIYMAVSQNIKPRSIP